MKKSLLVTHIGNIDYPIFRQWLEKYYSWFDEIIIYWDLSFRFPILLSFMQQSLSHLPNIKFLDPVERELGVDDWRDKATKEMLNHATGDWIISIEQDWLAKDWDRLLEVSEQTMKECDLFGWYNYTNFPYIHPAYFFIKRELLEKTSKDFSPHQEINGSDHFAMITHDAIQQGGKLLKLQDIGFNAQIINATDTDCFHLGGINQSYLNGLNDPNHQFHRGIIFIVYNSFPNRI